MTLAAAGITRRFGAIAALDGVDASFPRGSIVAILGPNGAGKSTLLRVLVGALAADQGRVELEGRSLASFSRSERVRRIAYVAQRPLLTSAMTVGEVVELGRYALPRDPRRIEAALIATQLDGERDRIAAQLSIGQQQRVALARALTQVDPDGWLVLDEPLAALDPAHAAMSIALLRQFARSGGGVIATIHDATIAAALADTALLLDRGRVMASGAIDITLVPTVLERLYGVAFTRVAAEGVVALVPRV